MKPTRSLTYSDKTLYLDMDITIFNHTQRDGSSVIKYLVGIDSEYMKVGGCIWNLLIEPLGT